MPVDPLSAKLAAEAGSFVFKQGYNKGKAIYKAPEELEAFEDDIEERESILRTAKSCLSVPPSLESHVDVLQAAIVYGRSKQEYSFKSPKSGKVKRLTWANSETSRARVAHNLDRAATHLDHAVGVHTL